MIHSKNMQSYFRRSRLVLRVLMLVLILLCAREFFLGFMDGLQQSRQDIAAGTYPTQHGSDGVGLGVMSISVILFVVIFGYMISILKEFEAGRFFSDVVLKKTLRIGILTEITCYGILPLAMLLQTGSPPSVVAGAELYFSHINYIGGVAGTFIRYLARILLIGKDLEETTALTV